MREVNLFLPHRMVLRSQIGLREIGIALLFVGLSGYFYAGHALKTHDSALAGPPLIALALGAAFTALTWRRQSVVDRASGTVTLLWGWIVPLFRRTRPMVPRSVVLERTMLWGDSPIFVHTLHVENDGFPPVFVARLSNLPRAHALGQRLAEFLQVELVDRSAVAEFRVSNFGIDRWNPERKRSGWFYTFDRKGRAQLNKRLSDG